MEVFWYIIAAAGAGIGTGLAGLSAATVMVPVLIVLCPSFRGETGAYQATAIALASDILGSAVTTYTYAKHKNIDLKRGWIMLVCILGMSLEGTGAMLAVSFTAGLLLLYFHYGMASGRTAAAVFAAAVCGAATEIYSPGEWDTVTVPAAALAVLLFLL